MSTCPVPDKPTKSMPKFLIHSPEKDEISRTNPVSMVEDDQTAATGFDDIQQLTDDAVCGGHSAISQAEAAGTCEENSNSSDQTCGYFSEDSNQSITDICGSPLELKVQIRQCSDEKLLEKNLSERNLLEADYISRPNEKCK